MHSLDSSPTFLKDSKSHIYMATHLLQNTFCLVSHKGQSWVQYCFLLTRLHFLILLAAMVLKSIFMLMIHNFTYLTIWTLLKKKQMLYPKLKTVSKPSNHGWPQTNLSWMTTKRKSSRSHLHGRNPNQTTWNSLLAHTLSPHLLTSRILVLYLMLIWKWTHK